MSAVTDSGITIPPDQLQHGKSMDDLANYRPMPVTPMPPETPLTATLTAAEWNVVQAGIRELPMKYVEQLSHKLARQLFAQAYEQQVTT